jgi:hypothetical protein
LLWFVKENKYLYFFISGFFYILLPLMSFSQNLFGAIAGKYLPPVQTGAGFIPNGFDGETIYLKGNDANWLGLRNANMQYWAYVYCSPLASIIDKQAECDVNGVLEVLKLNNDYTQSPNAARMAKLLRRPNKMQTWEQFRGEQVVYKKIFGYCPVFVIKPSGFTDNTYASSMWNLPPWLAQPNIDYSFNVYNQDYPIKSFSITLFNSQIEIESKNILMLTDGFVRDENSTANMPLSKIAGLDYAISNICVAMEADNVLLRKKGPLGVWAHDRPADNFQGYIPMKKDEKDELQKDLRQYGLGFDQFQYLVSRQAIKYVSAGYSVKDLMTKETVVQGIEMCCERYGVPIEVTSFKDVKYENKLSSERFMYQNNIIPGSQKDMRAYSDFFKLNELGLKIVSDFSDLPVLQENKSEQASALNTKTDALQKQYKDNLITKNQYRQELGYDTVKGDDVYFSDLEDTKSIINEDKIIASSVTKS